MKKIVLTVTNDLVTDNRLHKVGSSLREMGADVLLVGRILPGSKSLNRNYATHRLRLYFRKGPLFYFEYNFRLFWFLLFHRFDIYVANDLDTLPANFLAAKIKRKPLVYDSHEYFTQVPELIHRPRIQRIWHRLEKMLLPRVTAAYTVCQSIAEVYFKEYGVPFHIVRNLPVKRSKATKVDNAKKLRLNDEKLVLYQGVLNLGRGLDLAIRAMNFLNHVRLIIIGDGDVREQLEELVEREGLKEKVSFLGRIPVEELYDYTHQADLGISLEEDLGMNYRFALPNKLFDYIQAEIPVICSDLPEMKNIVESYKVGRIVTNRTPEMLADLIQNALEESGKRMLWKTNCKLAACALNWEQEEKILEEIYRPFMDGK